MIAINFLSDMGSNINAMPSATYGQTDLQAATMRHPDAAKLLLDMGQWLDIDLKQLQVSSPLILVALAEASTLRMH